ncbi:MAG TPA: hypothetical protein VMT52_05010, partial [Planctomycetota bacterium]|nr:hypothetical protein [Planctomycetota bacterium]
IETVDGTVFEGTIAELDLVLTGEHAGEVVLPRESLDRIEITPDGRLKATLKDGTEVLGESSASVTVNIGLLQRRFPISALKSVAFDRFIPLSSAETVEACPLRIELPVPEVVEGGKRWRVEGTSKAQCDGTFLTGLTFHRRQTGGYRTAGGAVTFAQLEVTPLMIIGGDGYQNLTVDVRLVQGNQTLGKGRSSFAIGPQEGADLDSIAVRYQQEHLEASRETPILQIQALLTEGEEPPAPSTGTWWFWISF